MFGDNAAVRTDTRSQVCACECTPRSVHGIACPGKVGRAAQRHGVLARKTAFTSFDIASNNPFDFRFNSAYDVARSRTRCLIPCQGSGAETRVRQLLFISAGVISMKGSNAWSCSGGPLCPRARRRLSKVDTNQAFLLLIFFN